MNWEEFWCNVQSVNLNISVKTVKIEANKTISVWIANANLSPTIIHIKVIPTSSSENVWKCTSTAWVFVRPSRVKGVHHTTIITWGLTNRITNPRYLWPRDNSTSRRIGRIGNFCWVKKNKIWPGSRCQNLVKLFWRICLFQRLIFLFISLTKFLRQYSKDSSRSL